MSTQDFYVTFGQRYRRQWHPQGGHPDGWVRIRALDWEDAREKATKYLGLTWANIHREGDFNKEDYPKGELAVR